MLVWFGGIPSAFALMPWYLESGGRMFWIMVYPLYAAIPYASAGFMPHREPLFDLIADTRGCVSAPRQKPLPTSRHCRSRHGLRPLASCLSGLCSRGW